VNPTSMPPYLSEATSAGLAVIVLFMGFGAAWSAWQSWRTAPTIWCFYRQAAAPIVLSLFFFSFAARLCVIWWQRFVINHKIIAWDAGWMVAVGDTLLITSLVAGYTGVCWLRETAPGFLGYQGWVYVAVLAVACALGSVYY